MANGSGPDLLEKLLSSPTADSLFTIFGEPQGKVTSKDLGSRVLGRFNPLTRNIQLNENLPEGYDSAQILAHELAHQATVLSPLGGERQPEFEGFKNLFESEMGTDNLISDVLSFISPGIRKNRDETMADALEQGFRFARQADPEDPGKMSTKVGATNERIPGTRAAYNLIVRLLADRMP